MGLDMYLNVVQFHMPKYVNGKIKRSGGKCPGCGKKISDAPFEKSRSVYEGVYWRKTNAIHKWFVDNVQKGKDDCGTYEVSLDQIKELKKLVDKVNENHKDADELLPTTAGFFFGDTSYDKYYFEDMKRTSKDLDKLIKFMEAKRAKKGGDIYYLEYHSSW